MKIYLAAPIFTTVQIAVVTGIKNECARLGHEVFSPYHNSRDIFGGRAPKDCSQHDRDMVLGDNISHLDWCHVLLAWVGGMGGFTDPGVVWEMGYAYKGGKFQLAYSDSSDERRGMNLMLAGTIDAFTVNSEELKDALTRLVSDSNFSSVREAYPPQRHLAEQMEPVV